MNKCIFTISILFCSFLIGSCRVKILKGEGNKGAETLNAGNFKGITIKLPVKAEITISENAPQNIQVNGYENIIKHIKAKLEDKNVVIYSDLDYSWQIDGYNDINIVISAPVINNLDLEGASSANVHGMITAKDLKIELSGASSAVLENMNVVNLIAEVSGAGNIKINGGTAQTASYEISGASKINAFPLQANEVNLEVSGASNGEVTALQKLTTSVSGASSVRYKGHPVITNDVSGASSIQDAN